MVQRQEQVVTSKDALQEEVSMRPRLALERTVVACEHRHNCIRTSAFSLNYDSFRRPTNSCDVVAPSFALGLHTAKNPKFAKTQQ